MLKNKQSASYSWYTDPGLTASLNNKFKSLFPKQAKVDYDVYCNYKKPAALRWASTWGRSWTKE